MEKVKLTKSQAEEIEIIKRSGHPVYWKEDGWLIERSENLVGLSFQSYMNAIYKGYEVEPDIKVGDFVDIGLFGINKVAEVTGVKGNAIAINGSDEYNEFKIIRILTDEEKQEEKTRRWWAKHDREVDHYKENDVIKESYNQVIREVSHVKDNIVYMKCGGGFGKYALKVICFAEDRKDI